MTSLVKSVDPENIDGEIIAAAGKIIRDGGLVAFPTETVYGLGGDAFNASSSKKIYEAKGRPSDNPLIIHIADFDDLKKVAKNIPKEANLLMKKFWPGPLTVVLEKTNEVPRETTGGLDTVAVRMPSNPIAASLIRAAGGFIAAPSANASGRPSTTKAQHVVEDLFGRVDMIIDGGQSAIGLESTIVDFTGEKACLLRPGYISKEDIEALIGDIDADSGRIEGDAAPKAPGMKYKHYAPKAPLYIVEGEADAVRDKIKALCIKAVSSGKKCGVLCSTESAKYYEDAGAKTIAAGLASDEDEIAKDLFANIRLFDDENVDEIYSEAFNTPRLGGAIMNRLLKAAGYTVIKV